MHVNAQRSLWENCGNMQTLFHKAMRWIRKRSFDSGKYWERRYAQGGTSGIGSTGALAIYKADIVLWFRRNGFEVSSSLVVASAISFLITAFRNTRESTFPGQP